MVEGALPMVVAHLAPAPTNNVGRRSCDLVLGYLRATMYHILHAVRQPHILHAVRQPVYVLPWLVLFWCMSIHPEALDFGWFGNQRLILCFGLLLMTTSGVASLGDRMCSRRVYAPWNALVTALALVLWQLGFYSPNRPADDWQLVALRAERSETPTVSVVHDTVVGLMLLDDIVRVITRFVASTPSKAWPFALVSRAKYSLWLNDEEWWESCYRGVGWMKLPLHPRLNGQTPLGTQHRLGEAMLWACMAVEAAGTVVVLPPHGGVLAWAITPCVAITLLVASCSPWLPVQSDVVFLEMMRLMRTISRSAICFRALWMIVAGLLLHPGSASISGNHVVLRTLEATALTILYYTLASQICAATMQCRVASPLYAVPADDTVPTAPLQGRPLYCGSLGLVEVHAPTRVCDWDCLDTGGRKIYWRDRYALHRSAERMTVQEAHLLSRLDALNARIAEADMEMHGSSHRPTAIDQSLSNVFVVVFMTALCMLFVHGCTSSCGALGTAGSCISSAMEVTVWACALVRMGQCWLSIQGHIIDWWRSAVTTPCSEVSDLQRQAYELHRSLVRTQWNVCLLEAKLETLGVEVYRPHRFFAYNSLAALRVIMFGWLTSIAALALMPARL